MDGNPGGFATSAREVVLLVEDPDARSKDPFVHAIVVDLPARDGAIATGALNDVDDFLMGRNSGMQSEYMAPSPPPGHGVHRYVFQLFALDTKPQWKTPLGRAAFLEQIKGHVLARGSLVGEYERR